jgi:DNA polymerase III subunit alpha
MYGVLDFYKECRKQGINPDHRHRGLHGPRHRTSGPSRRGRIDDSGGDTEGGKKLYYHLTLLAENETGYKNLIQLSSLAFLEGYYYKPRIDWELLDEYSEGLIATTGCLGGHVLQSLLRGDERAPSRRPAACRTSSARQPLRRAAGPRHPRAARTNPQLIEIAAASARRCSPPTTATTPTGRRTRPTTRCCACRPDR